MKKTAAAFFILLALVFVMTSCAVSVSKGENGRPQTPPEQFGQMMPEMNGQTPPEMNGQTPPAQNGQMMPDQGGQNPTGGNSGERAADRAEALDTSDQFTQRDLEMTADTSNAEAFTAESGATVTLNKGGVYVFSGTAKNYTIVVEAGDEDKVQIVLDGVTVTNSDFPVIYAKNADKIFVTTTDSVNTLTVTGAFRSDGETNTDAVIFSRDDVVLNGTGTLNVKSSDNGVTSKDDLKVTGGTVNIECVSDALEAHDSIRIYDGVITIKTEKDGLHAEYDEDDTVGYVYIAGGTLKITSGDDGIHATTICQIDGGSIKLSSSEGIEGTQVLINGGSIAISASDDGINASQKSKSLGIIVEINGGDINVKMGQGDTDGVDSNGNIVINGGTVNITGQSAFDYDGTATYTGGTVIINGETVDSIPNQFGGQGGGMGQGGPGGGMGPGGPGGGNGGMRPGGKQ